MAKTKHKVGDRFNSWTLLEKLPKEKSTTKWLCICDCGVRKIQSATNVVSGNSKSCKSCGAKKRHREGWKK